MTTDKIGKVRPYYYKVNKKRSSKDDIKKNIKYSGIKKSNNKISFKIKINTFTKIKKKINYKSVKKYYIDTFDEKGERIRIYGFNKQSEAVTALANMTADKVNDNFIYESKNFGFKFLAKNCLDNFCKTLKASTYKNYKSIYEKHFCPYFGNKKYESFTASTLNNYYIEKKEEGLSDKTIYNHRAFLSTIFRFNIDDRKITRNPVNTSIRIEYNTEEVIPYTPDEQKQLLEAAKFYKDAYYIIKLLLETGMRRGELVAFEIKRIDRLKKQYRLRWSSYDKQLTSPKTKKGIRNIDLSHDAIETIDEYLKVCSIKSDFLFPAPDCGLRCADVLGDMFDRVKAKAGITHGSIHTLRHTYASNQIAKGRHPKYVCVQMGHHSINVTMDIYGHLFPEEFSYNNEVEEKETPDNKNILELSVDEIKEKEEKLQKELALLNQRKEELRKFNKTADNVVYLRRVK